MGDPRVVNMSPVGLARFSTLRGRLSQESYDARRLFEAIGRPDNGIHEIPCATNYCASPDRRDKPRQAVHIITDWLVRHDFASPQ